MAAEYIKRTLEDTIREAVKYFPVITVTGPRQSGKTTMLKHLFPHLHYYSLENLDTRAFAHEDPVRFLHLHREGMILDEVHNAPFLLSYIQGIVDESPEKRFVLSGSSNFALLHNVSQSLAGRCGVFELLPLSIAEMAKSERADYVNDVDRLLYSGLYPAICNGKNIPKFLYPSYIKTYHERDVRNILNVKDIMQFNTFLKLCAGRIGSLVNVSELANEVGVTCNTAKSWLSILEASYIIYMLPPYFENSRKRLIKAPKLYFCDTGLACALLGIESPEQMSHDKMRGHLFENLIVTEFLKQRFNNNREANLYFYRDSNMNEVDILSSNGQVMDAYEVKSSMTYHPDFEKALRKINEWIKPAIGQRAVIYAGNIENHSAPISLLNYQHLTL